MVQMLKLKPLCIKISTANLPNKEFTKTEKENIAIKKLYETISRRRKKLH